MGPSVAQTAPNFRCPSSVTAGALSAGARSGLVLAPRLDPVAVRAHSRELRLRLAAVRAVRAVRAAELDPVTERDYPGDEERPQDDFRRARAYPPVEPRASRGSGTLFRARLQPPLELLGAEFVPSEWARVMSTS